MSHVFLGLLVSALLPRPGAQQLHVSSHQRTNAQHRNPEAFDKPSSVRLESHGLSGSSSASLCKCHPFKNSCQSNVHNVFSHDRESDRFRTDYEVWNFDVHTAQTDNQRLSKRNEDAPQLNREIPARSRARYTKLVDSPENKPYLLDDDYSLVNYIDNWKGLDSNHSIQRFHRKSEKKIEGKTHDRKRYADDREFQVEFHSSKKENEFRGSSYKLVNKHRRLPINRKVKSRYPSKYNRNYKYHDPEANRFTSKYGACKKKRVLWGQKRSKFYPKLGPKSGFLDEFDTKSRSSMALMGHVWHWATTRNYANAVITPRRDFVSPHNQEMGMMGQAFMPVMNLSDSLVRKSFKAKTQPQMHPAFQNAIGRQRPYYSQYIPNGNLQIGFPPNKNVALAVKPVWNQPPPNIGNPTRRPSIYFDHSTEYINPYENHYENFKNTPFWNARQDPPGLRGVWSSPVRLSNAHKFKIPTNIVQNQQSVNSVLSLPGLFENIHEDPKTKFKNGSGVVHKFTVSPVAKEDAVPLKPTPKVFETVDIVNLLQSALLPQNGKDAHVASSTEDSPLLAKSAPAEKIRDGIAQSKPLTQTTENSVNAASEDPKLIVDATKQALLSLFTTKEEPMMESLEDILRRNTDRKIPIVYDIEDAPQLSAQTANTSTENPTKNVSRIEDETDFHVLNRRGILKKNKTAVHKTVQKINAANTTLTTPWIVLATTENMLYSEMMEMERLKLNMTKKTKPRKSTSRTKINLFKNKKSNETTDETPQNTDEAKAKNKRDQKAVAGSKSGESHHESVTSEPRNGNCTCDCQTTPRPTKCCRCKEGPPLELTTKISCGPASLSSGSICCPDCHQEFTYKLGLRPLING